MTSFTRLKAGTPRCGKRERRFLPLYGQSLNAKILTIAQKDAQSAGKMVIVMVRQFDDGERRDCSAA